MTSLKESLKDKLSLIFMHRRL